MLNWRQAWHELNTFPGNLEIISVGCNLHINYSKEQSTGRLIGFLTDTDPLGTLEACNFERMDMVSSFSGAMCIDVAGLPKCCRYPRLLSIL